MNGIDVIESLPEAATVWDSTRYGDYQTCMRWGFFVQALGWSPTEPQLALEFGIAIHKGTEALRLGKFTSQGLDDAIDAFEQYYDGVYDLDHETLNSPRNKAGGTTALEERWKKHGPWEREQEVLFTERRFEVPIKREPLRLWHGVIDAVYRLRDDAKILAIDDKTTTWSDSLSWREQWQLSTQLGGYEFALHAHADGPNPTWSHDQIAGTMVDGFVIKAPLYWNKDGSLSKKHKNVEYDQHGTPFRHQHPRVGPLGRGKAGLKGWLHEVNDGIDRIETELSRLTDVKESDPVMLAFPRNPKSCVRYGRLCPLAQVCAAYENPLRLSGVPVGWKVQHWDPRNRDH